MKLRVLLLLLPAFTACDFFNTSLPCRENVDCPQAETCNDVGRCELVEIDAGANIFGDGGRDDVDAGPDGGVIEVDAGDVGPDGGPIDVDAGTDAGPNDAGPNDAGPNDVDAGVDAGPNDADAGVDAGPNDVDAGEDAGPNDVDAGVDAGIDAGPNFLDAGPNFGFEVVSVDLDSIPIPTGLTSQDFSGDCIATVVVFDSTDGGSWRPPNCAFPSAQLSYQENSNDAGPVAILLVQGLNIPANRELRLVGDHPVVIAATADITINGTIDARGNSQRVGTGGDQNKSEPGAGGNNAIVCANSTGADADLSDKNEGHGGGGGGGATDGAVGGLGNNGGVDAGGAGGSSISLSNLTGGCAGGNGSGNQGNDIGQRGQGGAGGGAIHLIAKGSIGGTGSINVSGSGGTAPGDKKLGGGGGGSGGTILLTSTILNAGDLALHAVGGGGASGASNTANPLYKDGYRSVPASPTAFGGGSIEVLTSGKLPGRGGVGGSEWDPTNGEDATTGTDHGGGGGGGGAAGRIILRATSTCVVAWKSYPTPIGPSLGGVCAVDANRGICGDGTQSNDEECDFGAFNIAGVGAGKVACGCSHDCMDVPCNDDGAIPTSSDKCDDCGTRSYTFGEQRAVLFCEGGPCTMECTDVSTSCDLICTSGKTCTMDCTNSNTCNMFCDANSDCNFSKCDNTTCETFQTTQTPNVNIFDND